MLYPQQNDKRNLLDLSGFWEFKLDPEEVGESKGWTDGLESPRQIAVPASWNELYPDTRDYLDVAWYAREFYVPEGWRGQDVFLRVGSANYAAKVWVNGQFAGEHLGGHLPFAFDVTDQVSWGEPNRVSVQVEGKLTPTRVPPGNASRGAMAGFMGSLPNTSFDFFPYTGIQRPVILYAVPKNRIEDVTVVTEVKGTSGVVRVTVEQAGGHTEGAVVLAGENGVFDAGLRFVDGVAEATLVVPDARLWCPDDPYLYKLTVALGKGDTILDRYALEVGIRTIAVEGTQILLNGEPIALTGFGRHEDFPVNGRGLNVPLIVKDYSLLKWVGANSYRTSHYPYSEEQMTLADREGILVIDEIPAVGLTFEDGEENIDARLHMCQQQMQELVARDKNHPSVIMWSVANEPFPPNMMRRFMGGGGRANAEDDAKLAAGTAFFQDMFDLTRALDPTRPVTLVGVMGCPVEWLALSDVVCVNRYWGWYTQSGQIEAGAEFLAQELDGLHEQLGKPIMVTEFGADTIAGMHSDPPEMWTEEYQAEFLRAYLDVAAERPFVAGMHVWNFADFKTGQSSRRPGGLNLKGVFTRDRRPKMAAHLLRERWATAPIQAPPAAAPGPAPAEVPIQALLNGVAEKLSGRSTGAPKTIQFDLGDEGAYRLVMEAEGQCSVEPGRGEATATLIMEAGTARKLLTGQLNPMVALTTGQIKAEGDLHALMALQGLR